jgi:hypothetical protein
MKRKEEVAKGFDKDKQLRFQKHSSGVGDVVQW